MSVLHVGVAGFGAIGQAVAQALDQGLPGLRLAAIAVRNPARYENRRWQSDKPAFTDLPGLAERCDVVVEAAPAAVFRELAEPVLRAGKKLLVLSSGALLRNEDMIDLARQHGGQIIIPSGAILGLDALTAAAEGQIHSVTMITRKPPLGLAGAPYLQTHGIDLSEITEPTLVFRGSPREAAIGFPANLNVAVSVSLAGIGADRSTLEIWADPTVTRNVHRVEVDSDSASFSMEIQNIPSENPKTGKITAQSVVAALRKLTAPLRVGT
ncbi:aspartate dehydrogenase [Bordetella holmesii]|uniref:L-aspartate dehydrogenase n=2 Tax=Bordetella holmesii TaxID=35814 RepID=A0A158M4A0_9BORD|nr:aspartate dehydrogenase [Bordetella holmesii]AHV94013.1 oxidoreductase, NAD-binding Rossmann fold family protein [Bordetella holmesii ATCC 51541]AIT27614.1 oxidoreductase, NAD-binding Rossmann fold family protein [Bordetella holmesii 44057]EWM40389.1 oxidoreductase, NAD-binding Rossmann fold family protein [Bordetella holmesii 35009]EWM44241.1 oxidoreductase, NAD-binding Rossmann fold family protein [Bordetella holmesii 41130]EWM49193.1 oxidoreductase, NAD-binding Rossmann fold family prote